MDRFKILQDRLTALEKQLQACETMQREAFIRGANAVKEQADAWCRMYAEENVRMAQDTVLLDPVLKGDVSTKAWLLSQSLIIKGAAHSSSAHTAKHIAERICNIPVEELQ